VRLPALWWGASGGQVWFVHELLGRWPLAAAGAALALAAIMIAAMFGIGRGWRDPLVRVSLLLGFGAWIFVALLRDNTPAWMVYACAPFGALLLGLGWIGAWPDAHRRRAARGLAGLALALSVLFLADRVATVRAGLQRLPGAAIGDVAARAVHDPVLRFWLPAWGQDAAARRLCRDPDEVAVHGDLATALHFGQGVAWALHCDPGSIVRLGGNAPRHLAALPHALAPSLGVSGEIQPWGYVLSEQVEPLFPARGQAIATHTGYVMDEFRTRLGRETPQRIAIERACAPGDLLIATNLLPGLNAPFELHGKAHAPLRLVVETLASRYYACPTGGLFEFELVVLEPDASDLFVLRRQ
jgi:hypothetical protein